MHAGQFSCLWARILAHHHHLNSVYHDHITIVSGWPINRIGHRAVLQYLEYMQVQLPLKWTIPEITCARAYFLLAEKSQSFWTEQPPLMYSKCLLISDRTLAAPTNPLCHKLKSPTPRTAPAVFALSSFISIQYANHREQGHNFRHTFIVFTTVPFFTHPIFVPSSTASNRTWNTHDQNSFKSSSLRLNFPTESPPLRGWIEYKMRLGLIEVYLEWDINPEDEHARREG